MIDRTPESDPGLIGFVRRTLGCGCPDELVRRTVVDVSPRGEPGLDVGGRLLVRLLPADDLDRLIGDFPETVERLLEERDRRGFNRLRLVVAHDERNPVGKILGDMLHVIAADDDRVFVHSVRRDELPSALNVSGDRRPPS